MLVNDTHRIVGSSTVKIERVSDKYYVYYNFREIEQGKLHIFSYCIFDYDDNPIFDMYVYYV